MPQFDFHSFSVQIFWTLTGFLIFYFLVLNQYLSNLSSLLKIRSKMFLRFTINSFEVKKFALATLFFS